MSILKLSAKAYCGCGADASVTMTAWFSDWEPHRTREECRDQAQRNLTRMAALPSALEGLEPCPNCQGRNDYILGPNRFDELEDKEDNND